MRRWKCEKNASFERCAPIGCLRVTWLLGGGNVEMKCPLPIGRAISSSSSIATALTNTAESIRLPPLITIIKFILFSLLSSTFFAISLAILHCRTQLMQLCNPTNAFSSRNPIWFIKPVCVTRFVGKSSGRFTQPGSRCPWCISNPAQPVELRDPVTGFGNRQPPEASNRVGVYPLLWDFSYDPILIQLFPVHRPMAPLVSL